MATVIFIIAIAVLVVIMFTGTKTGKALKTRASGTASEMISKDASTPEGAKAYYNAAIDTKEDDYRKAEELRAQMLGKISEYERQLRDLQKKCMQDSLKTQQFIDQGNDNAAMTYLKSQQDKEKDIEVKN